MDSNPSQVRSEALGEFWWGGSTPSVCTAACVMAQGSVGLQGHHCSKGGTYCFFPSSQMRVLQLCQGNKLYGNTQGSTGLHQDLALRNVPAGESSVLCHEMCAGCVQSFTAISVFSIFLKKATAVPVNYQLI